MQMRSSDLDRKAVLISLDTQISHLDTKIAALVSSKNVLEQARDYILSISTNNLQYTNGITVPASGPSMALSLFLPTKKTLSSLRRQAMIRNALGRDKSPTLPNDSGLLSSDGFEAAFGNGEEMEDGNENGGGKTDNNGDVRTSVEEETTTAISTRSTRSTTTASASTSHNASPASDTCTSSTDGQGAHWEAKRATKRKLQNNAAKAREARRRKLYENGRRTT
jgi:hypothetical protein